MSDAYSNSQLAAGAVKRGIARLAGKYPFHAGLLSKLRLVPSPSVGTMAVTAQGKGVLLLFNPEFVLSLDAEALGGVLLHEVHHVVLGHLGLDPDEFPDRWAFIVALEVSANEFVKEPLPGRPVLLEDFPMLPPMESSQQRYERLRRLPRRTALLGPGGLLIAGSTEEGDGGMVIDDHTQWGKLSDEGRRALADLVQKAALEAGGMPEELRLASRLAGVGTAGSVSVLVNDRQGALDWRQFLRRYVGRTLEPGPTFTRPPRRFPDLVGVWPGQRRMDARASVVAVIDTSGSVTDEILEQIDGELHRLSRRLAVHVVEADCEVHRVYRYSGRLKEVVGRGGTDFRPALEPSFLRPLKPELVIYFTDGFGTAPEEAPRRPLIWCLVPGGKPPAPWGRVIRMARGEDGA